MKITSFIQNFVGPVFFGSPCTCKKVDCLSDLGKGRCSIRVRSCHFVTTYRYVTTLVYQQDLSHWKVFYSELIIFGILKYIHLLCAMSLCFITLSSHSIALCYHGGCRSSCSFHHEQSVHCHVTSNANPVKNPLVGV